MSSRPFFRHPADAVLALGGVLHVALLLGAFVLFPVLPWGATCLAFAAYAALVCWNLQCVSHNFIHNPFFSRRWLNRAFGVIETLAIGVPHQLYHHYHMNHHQGNNDGKGEDGTTRDWSSTYRHSRDDKPEPFWRYCLFSFFRVETVPVLKVAYRHGPANVARVTVETLALVAMWAVFALTDWRFFLFFYLPSYFLGWVLSYAEGYLEHHDTRPDNFYANAVSSYHRLYNVLWFNNGYHQEHHVEPRRHWTRMKELHEELRPVLLANRTKTFRGPHLTGLIEDWLEARRRKAVPAAGGERSSVPAS